MSAQPWPQTVAGSAQAVHRVEGLVAWAEQLARTVIDVDQHRVQILPRTFPEPLEAVTLDQTASLIVEQRCPRRDQSPFVPGDHFRQELDDLEALDVG